MCPVTRTGFTLRGSGTGNYGQTTPLAGGVVLDMTGYNAFLWVRPGVARAQAGIRLGELEKQTKPTGQELRCVPSTYRSATLGGLFGGGFGGVGSINYGPLGAPGNVIGIRAMTIEPEPQIVELRDFSARGIAILYSSELKLGQQFVVELRRLKGRAVEDFAFRDQIRFRLGLSVKSLDRCGTNGGTCNH